MVLYYIFGSVLLISLLSVVAMLPLLLKKKVPQSHLIVLLSFSVGTLLGTVFFHFIPELAEEGYSVTVGWYVVLGFIVFLIVEKWIHWRHKECDHHEHSHGHGHSYHLAPVNLLGDAIHNFIDGLVIVGSYLVSIPLGIAATVSVLFHELPQEIADVGVLLYAGFSKKKALLFNFLSALTAFVGAILGLVLAQHIEGFANAIIPFAAGSFLYIAASNLVPELHRHCELRETLVHIVAILAGVGLMVFLLVLAPEQAHS